MSVDAQFKDLYGYEPAGVWAAPGRVNLIGEYTDFNEGFVMPLALPHTAVAAAARREDGVLRLHSADIDAPVVELRVDDLAPCRSTARAAGPRTPRASSGRCARRATRSPARTSTSPPRSRPAPASRRRPPLRSSRRTR